MDVLPNGELSRRARAIWAYSAQNQKPLAEAAGIHPDRLRAIVARTDPAVPTTDEILKLAAAVDGIPEWFAAVGFDVGDSDSRKLWSEIGKLRARLGRLEAALTRQPASAADLAPPGALSHAKSADPPTAQDPGQTENPGAAASARANDG